MIKRFWWTVFFLAFLLNSGYAELSVDYKKETYKVRSYAIDKIEYISLSDLNTALGGSWYWNPVNKKVVLTIQDRQFKFSLFSPYLQVDQEVYNLTYPVEFKEADLCAPLVTLVEILNNSLAFKIDWNPGDKKIKISTQDLDITSVRATQKVNGVLLEVYLSRPLNYELFTTADNWLHLNFFAAKLNPEQIESQDLGPLVQDIKAYQFENSCQVSFKLKRPFNKSQPELKDDPLRLRVSLIDTTIASQIRNPAFPEQKTIPGNPIDVIVLDPGHGGEDTGAKGPGGLLEKDVTLQMAKKVADLLREKGFKVILTREEDIFIPLGERTALANQKGADLFISIHANAAKRKNASGSETYFLARAKNDEARAVAALENASIRFERPDLDAEKLEDLDFILLDMVQNEFLRESQNLAALIQDGMEKHLPIPNRGVDQAGFFVLNKAYLPAVLVETAFISNPNEAKLLKKDSFQEKVAQAISDAVVQFKAKYEQAEGVR